MKPSEQPADSRVVADVQRERASHCGVCGGLEWVSFFEPADIVACKDCGVLFVSPRPTNDAIAAFYSASGHYKHWDEQPGRVAMWQRRLQRVRQFAPRGRLLDIGAGQGDFLAAARADYEVDGTEVSLEGQRLANERHGLSLRLGDATELDLPLEHYDVVTLWHVLEHVPDPRALVQRCNGLLKPGGLLCIAVPNTDERLRLTKARWRARIRTALGHPARAKISFPRLELRDSTEEVHLTHFTLPTLVRLLEREGFVVLGRGLDDCSPDNRAQARFQYHRHELASRALRRPTGPAIFVAGQRRA